jgi:hypothetical protein
VVAVEEGEVEPTAVRKQAREDDLRLLWVELDEVADACLLEDLEPDSEIRRPVLRQTRELVRIGSDVPCGRSVPEQALAPLRWSSGSS